MRELVDSVVSNNTDAMKSVATNRIGITINLGKHATFILVILAALSAGGIARWCMSSGVGVSPDSLVYLGAADSIIAGDGLKTIASHYTPGLAGGKPLTVFPPTYPLLLSLSGILSTDRLNGAKWLHSLLFAINVLLIGLSVYLSTNRSFSATLCSILLFLSSRDLLEIHTMAWSDPPFILFVLSASVLLALYISKPRDSFLVGSALMASLAITTRYVGITILPPMILIVLLLKDKTLRDRIRDCLILVGISVAPLIAWLLRNTVVGDSATSRGFAFHPIGLSDIKVLINTLLLFWVPFTANVYLRVALLLLGGGLVFSCVVLVLRDYIRRDRRADPNAALQMFAAAFAATYLLFTLVYNSIVDPAVELDRRILSPLYVFVIILVVSAFHKLSRIWSSRILWWGFLALTFALISVNAVHVVSFAIQRHDSGSGYASREWAGSASIAYTKTLSRDETIYSNGIDAVHFLTGREALRIPAKTDPTNWKNNAEFERDLNAMRNELMQQRAVVVYLDKITWRWYLPSKEELEGVYKLPVLVRLDDGVIYGIK